MKNNFKKLEIFIKSKLTNNKLHNFLSYKNKNNLQKQIAGTHVLINF